MLNTRDAAILREENLPDGAGKVSVLRLGDGRVTVKRFATRGKVINLIDRIEHVDGNVPLDESRANQIVDDLLRGRPWSDCFVEGIPAQALEWTKSVEEEHYTSTGTKFWRHQAQMKSYRANKGHTVISTHISPEGACNLRCPYCSVTYRDTHSRIPLARVQKYVTDLKSRGLKAVILTGGGEPTLYPQFNELVQWIKREGLSVALITNGTTADRVRPETWSKFSWVRVSINVFDEWRARIRIPREQLSPDCIVGASFIYTVEHEAVSENTPENRVELFQQVADVAERSGAVYIRVLPNCLLEQGNLVQAHRALQADLVKLGDPRFFQQYKVHGAPRAEVCHQAYFRPYLSEEPFYADGEPGTVYPCDSVVLNNSEARFAERYQICKPEDVIDFLDGKIAQRFDPRTACTGCVFTGTVDTLDDYKEHGIARFDEFLESRTHEEFV